VVQLQHFVEQVKRFCVLYFANFGPRNLFLLHLVGNEASVAIFESDFFDSIGSKEADQGNQVGDCEVLDLAAVIEREDWVALGKETQEDYSARPHIHCTALVGEVEEGFRRHVPLSACSVLYLHRFLQINDFKHVGVVLHCRVLGHVVLVHFDFRQAKVDQKSCARGRVVQKVSRLNVSMNYTHF